MLNMDRDSFKKETGNDARITMVEFWAPWCVYCRRIAPAMKKIEDQYNELIGIGQVNIDEEPDLAEKENIEVVPTFIIYKGGKAVDSITAPDSKAKIEEFIKRNL